MRTTVAKQGQQDTFERVRKSTPLRARAPPPLPLRRNVWGFTLLTAHPPPRISVLQAGSGNGRMGRGGSLEQKVMIANFGGWPSRTRASPWPFAFPLLFWCRIRPNGFGTITSPACRKSAGRHLPFSFPRRWSGVSDPPPDCRWVRDGSLIALCCEACGCDLFNASLIVVDRLTLCWAI